MKLRNFVEKWKCLNLGPKIPYLGIFGLEFENNVVIFEITTLELVKLGNFVKKWKCLNFGPKIAWGFFWLEFENNIVIFEISTLEFVKLRNFVKKWKCVNLGQKKCLIWVFWGYNFKKILSYLKFGIWKQYCHIWNQNPWNFVK